MRVSTSTDRSAPVLLDALPVAAAIGTFGVIYGAMAAPVVGAGTAVASSLLMFSGAAQFAAIGLLDGGATAGGVLLAVGVLGLRHLPLAAVVVPRLDAGRPRRALLALGLTDETVGLAVAGTRPAARTLAVVGAAAYVAWVVGTVAGVLGADLLAAVPLASVVFVVLFVGLAALTCHRRGDVGRAVAAAAVTAVLLLVAPDVGTLGAIAVALGCAATAPRIRRGSA